MRAKCNQIFTKNFKNIALFMKKIIVEKYKDIERYEKEQKERRKQEKERRKQEKGGK